MKKNPEMNTNNAVPPLIKFAMTISGIVLIYHGARQCPATINRIAIPLK